MILEQIILFSLFGICKAIRDTIAFRYPLGRLKSNWFSKWLDTKKCFLWFPIDAWHVFDFMSYLALGYGLALWFGIIAVVVGLTVFTFCYHVLFRWDRWQGLKEWFMMYFGAKNG